MLDLTKISGQMQGFSQHLTSEVAASHQRLELAQQYLKKAIECQEELVKRQEEWRNRIIFAGTPPTIAYGGTSDATTAFAATTAPFPMVIPSIVEVSLARRRRYSALSPAFSFLSSVSTGAIRYFTST